MSKNGELRKKLWDYLQSIGVKLNPTQHDEVKKIWEEYVSEKGGLMAGEFQKMQLNNEKMNQHHKYYHAKCINQDPPKKQEPKV